MTTLCLTMIVKNEAEIIRRALRSVAEVIDYWVICDTGSTDGTPELIRETLAGIPGELHTTEWVDFGYNRNQTLDLAQDKADYLLLIDADMVAHVHRPFKDNLSADAYLLRYEGDLRYYQPLLVSTRCSWRYHGATHEYIDSPMAKTMCKLEALTLLHLEDGANRVDRFNRDAVLLERALEKEPDDPRSMFYLGNTYAALGRYEEALEWLRKRQEIADGSEEEWYALYKIARVRELAGHGFPEVLAAYLSAFEKRPVRAEPLYWLIRYLCQRQSFHLAHLFSKMAVAMPLPEEDLLFVEASIYEHDLLLLHAHCSAQVESYEQAVEACNRLRECPTLSPNHLTSTLHLQSESLEKLYAPMKPELPKTIKNRLKVVVPFYNPGPFLDNCVASLLEQDYDSFEVIFVDDASNDGSHEKVPVDDPRMVLLRNTERVGGARNFHRVFTECCEPDDIVVHLDGDDWLACKDAFTHIDAMYREHDPWVLYGQFRFNTGEYGIARPYPDRASFSRLREVWYSSHIRTFRAGLYHRIADQDPTYSCMKNRRGEWLTAAMDMAVMYPILELAGYERVRYNDRVLYVYNTHNPLSVHKVRREEELESNLEICQKQPFRQIASYC